MPYLPGERQYRSFAASNFKPVERDADGVDAPPYRVRGHFTTFSDPYELFPGYYETIAPTALDECDMSDVIFQYDHQGMVLARQRNNSLRVGIDAEGGWAEATLDGCQQARDLYEAITNGLVDEMSFGFIIAENGLEWDEDDEGNVQTTITRISKLFDVSAVSIPANPGTEISARSLKESIDEARAKKAELESEDDVEPLENEERSDEEPVVTPEDAAEFRDALTALPNVNGATQEQIEAVAERMEQSEQAIDDETLRRYAEAIIAEMDRRSIQIEGTVEELDVEPAPVEELSTEERVAASDEDKRRARMRLAKALELSII